MSAVPEAEQCGWLKDKFGVSWQVVPSIMNEMMASSDPQKAARVTQAFLKMKKFDIAKLKAAFYNHSKIFYSIHLHQFFITWALLSAPPF
jgi:hypothetical protein